MTPLEIRILRRVRRRLRSDPHTVFVAIDFKDLGASVAIRRALARLARQGRLRRIARGLYDVPRHNPLLRRVGPPDLHAALQAIERRSGKIIVNTGMAAANRLGLTSAVQVQAEYLTDGSSRTLRIGSHVIRLRHTGRRQTALGHGAAGDLVRALHWLGRDLGEREEVARALLYRLTPGAIAELEKARPLLSGWVARVFECVVNASRACRAKAKFD